MWVYWAKPLGVSRAAVVGGRRGAARLGPGWLLGGAGPAGCCHTKGKLPSLSGDGDGSFCGHINMQWMLKGLKLNGRALK